MDGTGALVLYWAIGAMQARQGLYALMSMRVMVVGTKALGTSLGEAATGADLGGSSKYMLVLVLFFLHCQLNPKFCLVLLIFPFCLVSLLSYLVSEG